VKTLRLSPQIPVAEKDPVSVFAAGIRGMEGLSITASAAAAYAQKVRPVPSGRAVSRHANSECLKSGLETILPYTMAFRPE